MANRRICRWRCRGSWGYSRGGCGQALLQPGDRPLFRVFSAGGFTEGTAQAAVALPSAHLHHPLAGLGVHEPHLQYRWGLHQRGGALVVSRLPASGILCTAQWKRSRFLLFHL